MSVINEASGVSGATSGTLLALGPRHARPGPRHLTAARASVWRALVSIGDAVTVTVLSQRLGQHPNTVREHLDVLVAGGRAERLRSVPIGRGRPAWLYRSVGPADASAAAPDDRGFRAGDVEPGGEEYAALAVAMIDQVVSVSPDPRAMARQAGERWGRTLVEQRRARRAARAARAAPGARDGRDADTASGDGIAPDVDPAAAVVDLLGELRFEPERSSTPDTVRLTACPLLDAARHNPDVVCEVHLGIVRGALDRLGGDPDGARLEAFAEPGACLLTLPGRR